MSSALAGNKSIPGIRKHAGSSIQTSTSFDPSRQRKIPHKPLGGSDAGLTTDDKLEPSTPLTPSLDPASLAEAHALNEAQPSTQAGIAMEAPPNSPALIPASALSKASPQISRSVPCQDDAPSDQPQDHQSRLKFPGSTKNSSVLHGSGSGRSTPSLGRSGSLLLGKSGLARPSSRLSKQGEQHRSMDDLDADDEGSVEKGVPIPLTRKGSDGVAKKHKVAGSASLPRQMSKAAPDYSMFSSPAAVGGNGTLSSAAVGGNGTLSSAAAGGNGTLPSAAAGGLLSSESEVVVPEEQAQASLPLNPDGSDSRTKLEQPSGKRTLKMPSKIASGLPVPGTPPPPPSAATTEKPLPAADRSGEEGDVKHVEEVCPSSRLQAVKAGGAGSREVKHLAERKMSASMSRAGKDSRLMATMALPTAILTCESVTGSNSSLDSCSSAADIQAVESSKLDTTVPVMENPSKVVPLQKKGLAMSSIAGSPVSSSKDTAVSLPGPSEDARDMDKDITSPVATPSPRCIRRISPEGMSHEEALSPSEVGGAAERSQPQSEKELRVECERPAEKKLVETSDSSKKSSCVPASATPDPNGVGGGGSAQGKSQLHLPSPQGGNPLVGSSGNVVSAEGVKAPAVADGDQRLASPVNVPRIDQLPSGSAIPPKRARSLSPARPPRGGGGDELDPRNLLKEPSSLLTDSLEQQQQRPLSTSSSGSIGGDSTKSDLAPVAVKPLRSSLKSSMRRNVANGSDSSLERVQHRVTISPRESQIEYVSDHPIVSLGITSLSHASQNLAVMRSPGAVRRGSARGERKGYAEEEGLRPKLQAAQENMAAASTPQVRHRWCTQKKGAGGEGGGILEGEGYLRIGYLRGRCVLGGEVCTLGGGVL